MRLLETLVVSLRCVFNDDTAQYENTTYLIDRMRVENIAWVLNPDFCEACYWSGSGGYVGYDQTGAVVASRKESLGR